MAQKNDVSCYKGEAIVVAVAMAPVVDITGWSILFTLRPSAGSTVSVVSKAAIVTNGPAGTFHVNLTATDTGQIPQAYAYDIWRTDAGSETVLSIGTFTIIQDVR